MSRYQAYAEYKDSGVEWLDQIPSHWTTSNLRYLFSFGKGLTITKENLIDDGVPCVNYGEVHSKFGFEVSPEKHSLKCVEFDYLETSPSALLTNGDFVFADTSEDIDGSGNFTQLISESKVFAGYHTIIARPDERSSTRFFAYAFDSLPFRTQIRTAVKGVKVFSITQAILRNAEVWLPTIDERNQIANFLDHETAKIDLLIEKQQELIALLKEKRKAVINQAVTKGLNPAVNMCSSIIKSIGNYPAHWILKSLSMSSKQISVGLATTVTDYYCEDGVPIIRNMNIKEGYFDGSDMLYLDKKFSESQSGKLVSSGDVIVVRTGSNIGLACIVPPELDQSQTFTTLIVTTNDELINKYLTYCINSEYGKAEINRLKFGFGKDNLNVKEFKFFHTLIPPKSEQIEIVNFLEKQTFKIDRIIENAFNTILLMQERRTALISAAVTGKIDVRDWQAKH